jgi:hypothetical protein
MFTFFTLVVMVKTEPGKLGALTLCLLSPAIELFAKNTKAAWGDKCICTEEPTVLPEIILKCL